MENYELSSLIGKTLDEDLFDINGAVLIPRGTLITSHHMGKIPNHQLFTVPKVRQSDLTPAIENAVHQLNDIFEQIRNFNSLNLGGVYHNIIPTVVEVSEYPYVSELFNLLSNRDDYTVSHSFAVSIISIMLGRWLNFDHEQLIDLATASALHDVGKARIPLEVLNKPGKLTNKEFEFVKKHTIFGYQLIRNTPGTTEEQALAALHHHERIDGSGYLHGLHDTQISYFARIIAIADVFHAMGSKRVYHAPMPTHQILEEMSNGKFGKFDPNMMQVFIQRHMERLIGAEVLLSDGTKGIIRFINPNEPSRPLIETIAGYVDLMLYRHLHIEKILN